MKEYCFWETGDILAISREGHLGAVYIEIFILYLWKADKNYNLLATCELKPHLLYKILQFDVSLKLKIKKQLKIDFFLSMYFLN